MGFLWSRQRSRQLLLEEISRVNRSCKSGSRFLRRKRRFQSRGRLHEPDLHVHGRRVWTGDGHDGKVRPNLLFHAFLVSFLKLYLANRFMTVQKLIYAKLSDGFLDIKYQLSRLSQQ